MAEKVGQDGNRNRNDERVGIAPEAFRMERLEALASSAFGLQRLITYREEINGEKRKDLSEGIARFDSRRDSGVMLGK